VEPPGDIDDSTSSDLLPRWFQRGLVILVAAVLSFGGFGLFLAIAGVYHFALVCVVGVVGTAVLSTIAWPRRTWVQSSRPGVTLPAFVMCLGAVAFAAWNAHYSAHHVLIGRDSGVYAVTGKWIATHGNLEVPTASQWDSKDPNLTTAANGTYQQGDHTEFAFDHLTPVLLAEADNLGGDSLLFGTPAFLSALGLCAIYAVGCRLVRRPWLVLVAVGALAFALPELNVARETFSEPAVLLLLWAGMWFLLAAYERRELGMALLAGAAMTGTMLSRIDAPIYLIPLPVLGAVAWLSARSAAHRRWLARMFGVFLLGAIPVAIVGTTDVVKLAGTYYNDLGVQVRQIQLSLVASAVVAIVLVVAWPFARLHLGSVGQRIRAHRDSIATGAGIAVALAFLAAWAIRPNLMHPRQAPSEFMADLQRAAGLPVDAGRTNAEDSVIWLSWYLGPVTIALAAVGVAVAVARAIRRPSATYLLVLSVAGIGAGLYIWKPSISPDQIWAMRRFVPAAMPLLVLLAALALSTVSALMARQAGSLASRGVLAVGAAAMILFPIGTTIPVGGFRPEAGVSAAISTLCGTIGPKAAIVAAAGDTGVPDYIAALRSWCNVPVAMLTKPFSAAQIQRLADEWKAEGATLWVVGSTPALVKASAPGLSPTLLASANSRKELEMTINRPPSKYVDLKLNIYGSRVTA
jgi:hypothetical protein